MIRRLFWLTLGAALGVTGYRRLTALARSVPPVLRPGELTRFAEDVREGMALYAERHSPPTLDSQGDRGQARAARSRPGTGQRARTGPRSASGAVNDGNDNDVKDGR